MPVYRPCGGLDEDAKGRSEGPALAEKDMETFFDAVGAIARSEGMAKTAKEALIYSIENSPTALAHSALL
jgi:hypothetical protein